MADVVWATLAALLVTASFPLYIAGAWVILDSEVVTWSILVRHLKLVVSGLALTSGPVLVWMVPRIGREFGGLVVVHAFLGFQAYALLTFGLTGIGRIFQVKRRHNRYRSPTADDPIDELHEKMPHWRRRLRVGVFGYILLWVLTWIAGMARYVRLYDPLSAIL